MASLELVFRFTSPIALPTLRAAGGAADEKAFAARVGVLPDQVGDALEAKHRVEEERDL
jgi:hypothetical protein